MDMEKLEKLSELKEKGLLTQEEFEKQKNALLNNTKDDQHVTQKKGINWKNVVLSFLITIVIVVLIGSISPIYSYVTGDRIEHLFTIINIICAMIFTFIAMKLETKKYKGYCPAWEIFIGIVCLQGIGIWIAIYEFLQIKQGNAILKETVKK